MTHPVPVQKAGRDETFAVLSKDFKLSQEVMGLLLATNVADLEEFRFFFTKEEDIVPFLAKKTDLADKDLMAARLRRAWHAVRHFGLTREADRAAVSTADLDDLLDEHTLKDTHLSFWRRYKVRFPSEIMPADSLISRVSREMSRRMLMIYNLWLVRNLEYQLTSSKKRKRVGDGLYVDDPDEVVAGSHDFDEYLDKLFTYLLALAISGSGAAPGGADAAREAALGAETTQFVLVPLDICYAYFWRARRASQLQPAASRLQWLMRVDTAERSQWVSRFREGDKTLGVVIRETMQQRDAHWAVSPVIEFEQKAPRAGTPPKPPPPPAVAPPVVKQEVITPEKAAREQTIFGRKVRLIMKDGQALCLPFQHRQCVTSNCAKGLHKCAVVVSGEGRVCGGNHPAADCNPKPGKGKGGRGA